MKCLSHLCFSLCMILTVLCPAYAGLDESWDWPNDPATGQPRRKIRIKYGFPAGTKLGDKTLKEVMDEAVANWNGVKADTGWEFEVVDASAEADVTVETTNDDPAGGAYTEWQNENGRVKPGTAKVKFDPTPPGYDWDKAGKNKDDTKNPVSCAKHELSHLLRLDHQGGTRSVSLKLKDPQGKDTKDDDVTTVSADDKAEAKKTSTLAVKKDDANHPAGHDCELRVPTWPQETPEYPLPPDIPDIYLWIPDGAFLNPVNVTLRRRVFNSCPDPFLVNSGLRGRLIKGVEITLQGSGEMPRIRPDLQLCLGIPYEGGELGYGHFFDVGDPDYGPLEELGIYPVVYDPLSEMWVRLEPSALGTIWQLLPGTNRTWLYLPTHFLNMFGPGSLPFEGKILLGLAATYALFGDAIMVVPDTIRGGMNGKVIVNKALPAGPGGMDIGIVCTDPYVTAPATVNVPEGAKRGVGTLTTTLPPTPRHVPIQGSDPPSGYHADSFFDVFIEVDLTGFPPPIQTPIGGTAPLKAQLLEMGTGAPIRDQPVLFSPDGDPGGVAFTDAAGIATFAYPTPERGGPGTRGFRATYLGLPFQYHNVMADSTFDVSAAPTSLYVLDRTGTIGEPVILRAYLRRTTDLAWIAGRTVGGHIDATYIGPCVTNASGRADLPWTIDAGPASRTILFDFGGDSSYLPCSGTATLTALTHGTKMATFDRTARLGARTELKARLLRTDNTPIYNKPIEFWVEGTFVITRPTDVNGYARYPFYDVPDLGGAGVRTILCDFLGDGGYLPVSRSAVLTALPALPYLWVMSKTLPVGAIFKAYCYFRRLPDLLPQELKLLALSIDGTWIADATTGTGVDAGVARHPYDTTGMPGGAHTIRFDWAGDAFVDPGFGTGTLTLTP